MARSNGVVAISSSSLGIVPHPEFDSVLVDGCASSGGSFLCEPSQNGFVLLVPHMQIA
jgi:hypothetical protein